ncbi:ABC transporter ATP-binding protein [Dehalogenimonas alkenigignens]|uniref:Amino acid/amide ABC transporter ATP-binding protein 2, HAAT family n=1 Tax=Dehalogenimonas alkenigignens TaxID=1217799 RepID=A0A0W0GIT5_9CHLR|nr:ABC transporter ATP-binding protein [Dehalogenimonas alkenigignens]KTB48449.1 amino acid/amide ABC transporter ATP-binding protein 2, HAAT family [Dehalogenimonas alkenigignens]PVV85098.1 ABC transporter ATP-binding protein [Dehalogenimonas alkenigignens]
MLKLNNIEVAYLNVIRVLHGVSLSVPDGQIVTLLGANGAGKTTTLKAISGLLHVEEGDVTDGNIEWNGERIDRKNAEYIGRLGIVQALEGRRVFEHLTAEENLLVGAFHRKDRKEVKNDLEMVYNYFSRLRNLRNNTAGYLSGGEQQMVVIGRAMMARPKLMMLDEPSLGLAPLMVDEIYSIIRRFNEEQQTSVLLVEQNVRIALSIAHYGYVMENGRVVLDGTADFLKNNEDVKEFYMGLSAVGKRKSYRDVKHYKRRKRWL